MITTSFFKKNLPKKIKSVTFPVTTPPPIFRESLPPPDHPMINLFCGGIRRLAIRHLISTREKLHL